MKLLTIFVFLASVLLLGCKEVTTSIEESDISLILNNQNLDSGVNGKTIALSRNSNFTLQVSSSSTNSEWYYSISDTNIIKLDGRPIYKPKHHGQDFGNKNNDMQIDMFLNFKVSKAGKCNVIIQEKQQSLKNEQIINSINFNVVGI